MEMEIDEVTTRVEAATGKTYIRISGVAFHEGVNKNGWGVRPALAKRLAEKEMVGADVTLSHPKAEMGRFKRNMNGGVDEAVVGTVVSASYHKDDEDEKRYEFDTLPRLCAKNCRFPRVRPMAQAGVRCEHRRYRHPLRSHGG